MLKIKLKTKITIIFKNKYKYKNENKIKNKKIYTIANITDKIKPIAVNCNNDFKLYSVFAKFNLIFVPIYTYIFHTKIELHDY